MADNGGRVNIDEDEIRHFGNAPDDWWNPKSPLKALHAINPLRLRYIRERTALKEREVLDIGCGGGILSEALAAEGGRVTGIDLASTALAAARSHMVISGVRVDYRRITAEALAVESPGRFHVVTCMELLEHVPDPQSIVAACATLLAPGGDLFLSTINKTWLAGLLVIAAAERLLGIVRKGTHHYDKFIPPACLAEWSDNAGLAVIDLSGFTYVPVVNRARLVKSTRMNYMMHLKKAGNR